MTASMRFIEFLQGVRDGTVRVEQDKESPRFLIVTNADGLKYRLSMDHMDKRTFIDMLVFATDEGRRAQE